VDYNINKGIVCWAARRPAWGRLRDGWTSWAAGEEGTGGVEGGFYGGRFGEVVFLLGGDEDMLQPRALSFSGYEAAQEAGAAG